MGKSPRKLSEADIRDIVGRYEAGEHSTAIALYYDTSSTRILSLLRRSGVSIRTNKLTGELREQLIARYKQGESIVNLAREYGIRRTSVQKMLIKQGVDRRKKRDRTHTLNEAAFDTLTPTVKYWTGFLFADGHISDSRRPNRLPVVSLCLSETDINHVEKFRGFLGSGNLLTRYVPKRASKTGYWSKPSIHFSASSERIVGQLQAYGMCNQKLMDRIAPPEFAMSPDFWRGAIDGDGSLMIDRKGRATIQLLGNRFLLMQFANFIRSYIPESLAAVKAFTDRRLHYVRIYGHQAVIMMGVLYADAPLEISLERKRSKALEIIASYQQGQHQIRLTDDDKNSIVERYLNGEHPIAIAADYGVCRTVVYLTLKARGVATIHRKKRNP